MGEALSRKIDCPAAGIKFRSIDLRLRATCLARASVFLARGQGGRLVGIPRFYVLLSLPIA